MEPLSPRFLLVIPRPADPRWRFNSAPEDDTPGTSNPPGGSIGLGDAGPAGVGPAPTPGSQGVVGGQTPGASNKGGTRGRGDAGPVGMGSPAGSAALTLGSQSVVGQTPSGNFEEGPQLYRRTAEVTQVSRIGRVGRAQSVLRIKTRTRMDREAGIVETSPAELARRVSLASEAAAAAVFDMVGFRDLALAGTGVASTFHFLPQNIGDGECSVFSDTTLGATLSNISTSRLLPLAVPGGPSSNVLDPGPSNSSQKGGRPGHSGRGVRDSVSSLVLLAQFEKAGLIQGPSLALALVAVQETWSLAKVKVDAVGQTTLIKMFERHPEWVKLFGFRDDVSYQTGRAFKVNE